MCDRQYSTGEFLTLLTLGNRRLCKMRKNYYTENEVVLCTYAARYDVSDFGGARAIDSLTGRGLSSINSKIRNIAATLDMKAISRFNSVSPLTGRTTGESARATNWNIIEPLTHLSKQSLMQRCSAILG